MSGEKVNPKGRELTRRLTDVAAYLSEGLVGPCAEWAETTSDMARPLLIAANLLHRVPTQGYHVSDPNHAPGCPLRTFVYEVGSGETHPGCQCPTMVASASGPVTVTPRSAGAEVEDNYREFRKGEVGYHPLADGFVNVRWQRYEDDDGGYIVEANVAGYIMETGHFGRTIYAARGHGRRLAAALRGKGGERDA